MSTNPSVFSAWKLLGYNVFLITDPQLVDVALLYSLQYTRHNTTHSLQLPSFTFHWNTHHIAYKGGDGIDTIHINAHQSFMNWLITCLTHYTILLSKHLLTIQQMSHTLDTTLHSTYRIHHDRHWILLTILITNHWIPPQALRTVDWAAFLP